MLNNSEVPVICVVKSSVSNGLDVHFITLIEIT